MTLILIGAFLVVAGVVFIGAQPLRSRLSGSRRSFFAKRPGPEGQSDTLEPRKPAQGFGITSNWPGLAMVAVGAVLLLGALFLNPL